jgi:hypothetical protein
MLLGFVVAVIWLLNMDRRVVAYQVSTALLAWFSYGRCLAHLDGEVVYRATTV